MSKAIEELKKYKPKTSYRKLRKKFKNKNSHSYTMFVLSLFTLAFFGFFAIRPTLTTIAGLKKRIEDSREVDKRLSAKINQLVAAQAEYDIIEPFVPQIKAAVPESSGYFALLRQLDGIREKSEASVAGIVIGETNISPKKAGVLDIGFESEGGFLSINGLLEKILANGRILTVEKLNFSLAQKNKEEIKENNILKSETETNAYYLGKESE